jgi:hypothetical protein
VGCDPLAVGLNASQRADKSACTNPAIGKGDERKCHRCAPGFRPVKDSLYGCEHGVASECFASSGTSGCAGMTPEMQALLNLYGSTQGVNWVSNAGWPAGGVRPPGACLGDPGFTSPCPTGSAGSLSTWTGIRCGSDSSGNPCIK